LRRSLPSLEVRLACAPVLVVIVGRSNGRIVKLFLCIAIQALAPLCSMPISLPFSLPFPAQSPTLAAAAFVAKAVLPKMFGARPS